MFLGWPITNSQVSSGLMRIISAWTVGAHIELAAELLEAQRVWAAQHVDGLIGAVGHDGNEPVGGRSLRIGPVDAVPHGVLTITGRGIQLPVEHLQRPNRELLGLLNDVLPSLVAASGIVGSDDETDAAEIRGRDKQPVLPSALLNGTREP